MIIRKWLVSNALKFNQNSSFCLGMHSNTNVLISTKMDVTKNAEWNHKRNDAQNG